MRGLKKFSGGDLMYESARDEEGQGLVEYILIIALVAVIVVIALTFFGVNVKNSYQNTANGVASPLGG